MLATPCCLLKKKGGNPQPRPRVPQFPRLEPQLPSLLLACLLRGFCSRGNSGPRAYPHHSPTRLKVCTAPFGGWGWGWGRGPGPGATPAQPPPARAPAPTPPAPPAPAPAPPAPAPSPSPSPAPAPAPAAAPAGPADSPAPAPCRGAAARRAEDQAIRLRRSRRSDAGTLRREPLGSDEPGTTVERHGEGEPQDGLPQPLGGAAGNRSVACRCRNQHDGSSASSSSETFPLSNEAPPPPHPNSKCGFKRGNLPKTFLSKRFSQKFLSSVKRGPAPPHPNSKCGSKRGNLPKTFLSKLICTQTLNNFYKP